MRIPYVDLTRQHGPLKQELLEAAGRVIDHCQFVLGAEVAQLEKAFAQCCGVQRAVAVNSGTDALILALRALEIGDGDEVITAPNSFVATTSAIAMTGARPVFVDVGDDLNLNPALIEPAITCRTRAILPVHLTGRPANMTAILEVADRHGLAVIEDCAQAVLARHRDQPVGSLGTMGCFSLHPLKTLSACGDGGMLTTDDHDLADRLELLRNLGLKSRDSCYEFSGNSRLDTLQAAFLLVKLRHLAAWTERRRQIAAAYRRGLEGLDNITFPVDNEGDYCVYHTCVVLAHERDRLRRILAENGIGSAIHYPIPIHLQPAAVGLGYRPGSLPRAERQVDQYLSLPVYPELTEAEVDHVIGTIRRFAGSPES
jgi:dTDP-4-amino-4,6-dideoxygalactose transaminase